MSDEEQIGAVQAFIVGDDNQNPELIEAAWMAATQLVSSLADSSEFIEPEVIDSLMDLNVLWMEACSSRSVMAFLLDQFTYTVMMMMMMTTMVYLVMMTATMKSVGLFMVALLAGLLWRVVALQLRKAFHVQFASQLIQAMSEWRL